jgi:hypothetical protein
MNSTLQSSRRFGTMADRGQLCSKLLLHFDCVGEPPSPVPVSPAGDAAPDLDQLRAPVHGFAGALCDGVGSRYSIGSGS